MNKEDKIQALFKKLQKRVDANLSFVPLKIFYSRGKRKNNKRMYIKIDVGGQVIFGKFPLNKGDKMVIQEANKLKKISINQFSVPKVILSIGNGFFMTSVRGTPIEIILKKQGLSKSIKILKKAIRCIASFHQTTEKKNVAFKQKFDIYLKLTDKSSIALPYKNLLKKISVGYMHGDLDPFNMFFDIKTSQFSLIDWEDFYEEGFQELDILHFLIMTAVILYTNKDYDNLYNEIFCKKTYLKETLIDLLKQYCQLRQKDLKLLINLLPIYCDFQTQRLINSKRNPKEFLYLSFKDLFQRKGIKIF